MSCAGSRQQSSFLVFSIAPEKSCQCFNSVVTDNHFYTSLFPFHSTEASDLGPSIHRRWQRVDAWVGVGSELYLIGTLNL